MAILHPRNNVLNVNPPSGDQFLTTNGSNWLYTVTAIFGLSLVSRSSPLHPLPLPLETTYAHTLPLSPYLSQQTVLTVFPARPDCAPVPGPSRRALLPLPL